MKYLQKFESYNSNFIYDLDNPNFNDKRGFFKIKEYLNKDVLDFDDFLERIKQNLFHFGLLPKDTVFKLIGGGEFGIAFEFYDKVLKITTSAKEYVTCMNLVDMEYKGLVRYYLSFQFSDLPIWIIVMDKLEIPNKMERDIYTTLYYMGANDLENPNFQYVDRKNLFKSLIERLKNPRTEDQIPSYDITRKELEFYFERYMDLVDNLKEQDLSTDDLHGENIGIKDGELVHFDIMVI